MSNTLETVIEQSFLDYSAYVIQRRAIPDARDGMKFSARQIVHAQHGAKLDAKHPFKKSAKSVSAATSFSYVHGDVSCYEQIVRMGRPLVQRYFLEEIQGNGGTPINSSDYAAPRYTEARLSKLAGQLFEMINMNTLQESDWEPTYDEEGKFPKVLPSVGFYGICNGSFGSIAPTMISSIPQFNLKEVNDAIISLISDKSADVELLPDFASGGTLLNPRTTISSLAAGEGKSALLRGQVSAKPGYLEVTELPYGVYTNTVCVELQKALDAGGDVPFTEFKDLTKRTVNIRVYTKDPVKCEEWLYKNTSIQRHFTIKMIMLDNGKTPKLFNIKTALLAHIEHAKGIYRRATEWELQSLVARAEILQGLIRAYSIIDDIVEMIRASSGRADAIIKLCASPFDFTRPQAEAIVDLRLHRLSNMDIAALQDELKANHLNQDKLQEILTNARRFNEVLISIYEKIANEFGDKRRTRIYGDTDFEKAQDGALMKENFYMVSSPTHYHAEIDIEGCGGGAQIIAPTDDVIIVTSESRAFLRKATEFAAGKNEWSSIIKLNPGEQVLFCSPRRVIENEKDFTFYFQGGGSKTLHISYLLVAASKRGKKILPGKQIVTGIIPNPSS